MRFCTIQPCSLGNIQWLHGFFSFFDHHLLKGDYFLPWGQTKIDNFGLSTISSCPCSHWTSPYVSKWFQPYMQVPLPKKHLWYPIPLVERPQVWTILVQQLFIVLAIYNFGEGMKEEKKATWLFSRLCFPEHICMHDRILYWQLSNIFSAFHICTVTKPQCSKVPKKKGKSS